MSNNKVADLWLYRWRYVIGYTLISLAGLALFVTILLFIPGGLSENERQSVVATTAFSFHDLAPASIINAPYHILQWASIRIFGLNELSVKLPSAIIAVLTVVGAVGLLRHWFRRNVAILTTIIIVTTGQFLFVAQEGTPVIMTIFWSVWILFAALMVSRMARFSTLWKVILFAAAALSLYTPLSIYMLVAVISAGLVHPHLRYLIRQISISKGLLATVFALGIITPLVYAIALDHSLLNTLVGWPSGKIDWMANLSQLADQYVDFTSDSNSALLTPIYGLGSIMLVILGIFRFVTTKYTARNYILTAWIILLIPVIILNPGNVSVTFVPIMLLTAMGVDLLFRRWYSLFPHNPYARIAGLIPLAILIGGMITSGIVRYVDSYLYDPVKVQKFSHDLRLVNQQIAATPDTQTLVIVVTKKDEAFYHVLAKYNHRVKISTEMMTPRSEELRLVARDVQNIPTTDHLVRIITDSMSLYGDRFYLYQK